jgi:hypothetical protein
MLMLCCMASLALVSKASPEDERVLSSSPRLNSMTNENFVGCNNWGPCKYHYVPYSNEVAGISSEHDVCEPVWCIGGDGGNWFIGHAEDAYVTSLTIWPHGGKDDAVSAFAWTLSNDNTYYKGNGEGESTRVVFEAGDYLIGDVLMNSKSDRLGRLNFKVRRAASGQIDSYDFGDSTSKYDWHFPADGYLFAGFHGQSGSEIDALGVIFTKPDCTVVSREITNIECVTPVDGETLVCASVWADAGTTDTAQSICDFCQSENSGLCDVTFRMVEKHTSQTTSTDIDKLGGSATIGGEFAVGFLGTGSKATAKMTVSYSHTWEDSKSQTFETTNWISSTCGLEMQGGTKSAFNSTQHLGHMTSDIKLTVSMTDTCGATSTEAHTGTVVISNVPLTAAVTECTPYDMPCTELVV